MFEIRLISDDMVGLTYTADVLELLEIVAEALDCGFDVEVREIEL